MANLDTKQKRNDAFLDLWGSILPDGAIGQSDRWAISGMYLPGGGITPALGGVEEWVYTDGGPGTQFSRGWVHFKESASWICRNCTTWLKSNPPLTRMRALATTGP